MQPLDKDDGRAHLRCQQAWCVDYEKLFLSDPHYSVVSKTPAACIATLVNQYHALPSKPVLPVQAKGALVTAYHLN